ncbi:hypothetical protein OG453_13600 [Streptomyces sp. NBC_01381]|uniref:hypothetical protein n=1 Tax=Streptomyces sp. NBC_01381 TaxID=2903845 RepID=UPI00225523A1|nr:hypothetical protein [Streptomyces sp. NBC_01381]MCX4667688.1 hypothetical protein [Streptomyces sp. NBC_01381]
MFRDASLRAGALEAVVARVIPVVVPVEELHFRLSAEAGVAASTAVPATVAPTRAFLRGVPARR